MQQRRSPRKVSLFAVGDGKVFDNGKRVAPEVKAGDKILSVSIPAQRSR